MSPSWIEVLLAFEPQRAAVARGGPAAGGDQIVVGQDLGADEALLDVAVDRAGRGARGRRGAHGPGAAFVLADREERDAAEQVVRGADHAVERRLADAQVLTEGAASPTSSCGDLGLDLGRQRNDLGLRPRRERLEAERSRALVERPASASSALTMTSSGLSDRKV